MTALSISTVFIIIIILINSQLYFFTKSFFLIYINMIVKDRENGVYSPTKIRSTFPNFLVVSSILTKLHVLIITTSIMISDNHNPYFLTPMNFAVIRRLFL